MLAMMHWLRALQREFRLFELALSNLKIPMTLMVDLVMRLAYLIDQEHSHYLSNMSILPFLALIYLANYL